MWSNMNKHLQWQHVNVITIITVNVSCRTAVSKRHLKLFTKWDPAPICTSAGYKMCGVGVRGWGPIGGLVGLYLRPAVYNPHKR